MAELETAFKNTLDEQNVQAEVQAALKADGMTNIQTLLGRCATEAVLGKWFLVRAVKTNKVPDVTEESWEFSTAWSAIRYVWQQAKGVPEPEGKATCQQVNKEDDERLRKKRKRADRRENAKTHFEANFAGSIWGSDRVSPSDDALETCTWVKGEPPEWHSWCSFSSVEEAILQEQEKREKQDAAEKRRKMEGKKRSRDGDPSDEEPETTHKFDGGLWKAQTRCELRHKLSIVGCFYLLSFQCNSPF
jgi:hypothetical protein